MTLKFWLGLLLLACGSIAQAQVRPQLQKTRSSPHALSAREGKVIVNAAWEREELTDREPDCSHLAHDVYTLAGYPYPYARSIDLYVGIRSFVRVTKPQPGDLIVWRGHVGIVVDPAEHSFYSSLRSGLRTDLYDAPEWKARGPARFYRYAAAKPTNLVLTENRPEKTRRNAAPSIPAPLAEDSAADLADPTRSTSKTSDTGSPATRTTSENHGGLSN
jgi:hypothetical protein